jgi:opacity protein-like surface antigen
MTIWPHALAFAALSIISCPAFAQDSASRPDEDVAPASSSALGDRGLYVAVSGGLVLSQRLRTDAGVSAELDDGYMALGAVGGHVGPFRAELEGSYRRASVDSASALGIRVPSTGSVSALSGMGNLYLEPSLGLGSVRPYVGGGVGVSRFRAREVGAGSLVGSGTSPSLGTFSGSKTVFAYQAMAGLSGPVTDHVTASFGYRYFATPSASFEAPSIGDVRVRGLRSHSLEAGLRFTF